MSGNRAYPMIASLVLFTSGCAEFVARINHEPVEAVKARWERERQQQEADEIVKLERSATITDFHNAIDNEDAVMVDKLIRTHKFDVDTLRYTELANATLLEYAQKHAASRDSEKARKIVVRIEAVIKERQEMFAQREASIRREEERRVRIKASSEEAIKRFQGDWEAQSWVAPKDFIARYSLVSGAFHVEGNTFTYEVITHDNLANIQQVTSIKGSLTPRNSRSVQGTGKVSIDGKEGRDSRFSAYFESDKVLITLGLPDVKMYWKKAE
jgi:hypothetical protein